MDDFDERTVCILERVTDFLIRVGEHCLECNSNNNIQINNNVETTNIVDKNKTIKPVKTVEKKKTGSKHNVKISYLQKWIQQNNFETFTLDQFFKAFPKQKRNSRLNHVISGLIGDKKISQIGQDKFRVNGGMW